MAQDETMLSNERFDDSEAVELGQGTVSQALATSVSRSALAVVPATAQNLLLRMFADPYLLEKTERADLASQMRECVTANPEVSELRVLLGMTLCVNFEVPEAIEQFGEGVRLSPQSFIANLKMGELWMRLRVMDKAEEHTTRAAKLATNRAQAELARRQAASIRAMKLAGIERGGYKSPWSSLSRSIRRIWRREPSEALATADAGIRLT